MAATAQVATAQVATAPLTVSPPLTVLPPRADEAPAPPHLYRVFGELPRLAVEYGSFRTIATAMPARRGDERPVLVLPGLMASDTVTSRLRHQLRQRGYWVHGWGLGRNNGFTDPILDNVAARLESLASRHDAPLTVVGWSAGGILARWLAHERPDLVRHVITLGSPVDPGLTRTRASAMLARSERKHPSSARTESLLKGITEPLDIPFTAIYSRADAVLNWRVCSDVVGPQSESVCVPSSHMGFCWNLAALLVVLDRLGLDDGVWRPFDLRTALLNLASPAAFAERLRPRTIPRPSLPAWR